MKMYSQHLVGKTLKMKNPHQYNKTTEINSRAKLVDRGNLLLARPVKTWKI